MKLRDKVAIVTGSSRGIGKGIAEQFSAEGARVVVVCPDRDEGQPVADALGSPLGKALFVETDVTKSDQVQALLDRTIEAFGKLDVLVNNVGYHISKNIEQTTEQEWDFIINTNLKSTFLCSKLAIPLLRHTRGCIVNISSMVGLVGQSNAGAYSATKGGQIAMSKGMALDFAPDGIRVNVICPGWIQTPLVEDWFNQQKDPEEARRYIYSRHPLGGIGTPEDCGRAAVYLASEDARFVTGVTLSLDGGITLGY